MKPTFAFFSFSLFLLASAPADSPLAEKIRSAQPGTVVQVPPGEHVIADVAIPEGVTLRGSGYEKSVLDASGANSAIIISAPGVTVSDLTVRNARASGLMIQDTSRAKVARVRLSGSLNGLLISGSKDVCVENSVMDNNRTGISASRSEDITIVNCTLFNNGSLGASLTFTTRARLFNTIIANSATGIFLSDNTALSMDHNQYLVNYIGKIPGRPGSVNIAGWSALTGHDTRSIQLPAIFDLAKEGNFTPTNPLSWALDRFPGSGMGVAEFGGEKAPANDLIGASRADRWDLGALSALPPAPGSAPHGEFQVTREGGAVSAGLFQPDGTLVAYLFQNLPLPKGTYHYWIPSRNWEGKPIPEGKYELRTTQADLHMDYRGLIFNNAPDSRPESHDSLATRDALFTPAGRLLLGCGWSESHLQVREFDPNSWTPGWTFQGASEMRGMAMEGKESLFLLRKVSETEPIFTLTKVRTSDGHAEPIGSEEATVLYAKKFSSDAQGLAVLGKQLFVSDPGTNTLWIGETATGSLDRKVEVPEAREVVADTEHNVVWLIEGKATLVAVDARGKIRKRHSLGYNLDRLSANAGRLATLSTETGKIETYEITSELDLRPLHTFGTGADPIGPFRDDTFTFKKDPARDAGSFGLALDSDGGIFVIDSPRMLLIAPDGAVKKSTIAVWGQHPVRGTLAGDQQPRWWNIHSTYSIIMDSKNDTWKPDGIWAFDPDLRRGSRSGIAYFSEGERNFALFRKALDLFEDGTMVPSFRRSEMKAAGKKLVTTPTRIDLVEFDGYRGRTVVAWEHAPNDGNKLSRRTDTNGDGLIDEHDEPSVPVTKSDGTPVRFAFDPRLMYLDDDRNLLVGGGGGAGMLVPYVGLGKDGLPEFGWDRAEVVKAHTASSPKGEFTSPFDLKTVESLHSRAGEFHRFKDGSMAYSLVTRTGGGIGYAHVAGSDLACVRPDGSFKWFVPLPWTEGVHGIQIQDDILITQDFSSMDWYFFNPDGLGLGVGGVPYEMCWLGMWNDHPEQYRLFRGNDGEVYAILADYILTGFHLFRLEGRNSVTSSRQPITISASLAQKLATAPALPVPVSTEPPTFEMTVPKLAKDLPIGGDMAAWRDALPVPQIIVSPETSVGSISGPEDASAVIRIGHRDGSLYVQVIRFDDVVTMHQPLDKHYKQDSVEMSLNSFLAGFKLNVTRTREHGETVLRERFALPKFTRVFSPEEMPRSIKVQQNAKDLPERKFIEDLYGVDLASAKAVITEFRVPLKLLFEDDPQAQVTGISGDAIWLGFMVNDNDMPGSDTQDLIVYPATYNTFATKERGIRASLE